MSGRWAMATKEALAEGVDIYLGDCRDVLPTLSKVDAVVTDPPYGTKVIDWDLAVDHATFSAIMDLSKGYSAFFYSNTRLADILTAIKSTGRDAWTCVWFKSNAMGFERRFAPQWVPIVIAYRGNPLFWGKDLYECPIVPQKIEHPTPKQLGITEWVVRQAVRGHGGIVLDPFMGSGTTGVACCGLGRSFIGIEKQPKYFDIACRRISEALKKLEVA